MKRKKVDIIILLNEYNEFILFLSIIRSMKLI